MVKNKCQNSLWTAPYLLHNRIHSIKGQSKVPPLRSSLQTWNPTSVIIQSTIQALLKIHRLQRGKLGHAQPLLYISSKVSLGSGHWIKRGKKGFYIVYVLWSVFFQPLWWTFWCTIEAFKMILSFKVMMGLFLFFYSLKYFIFSLTCP